MDLALSYLSSYICCKLKLHHGGMRLHSFLLNISPWKITDMHFRFLSSSLACFSLGCRLDIGLLVLLSLGLRLGLG